MSKRAEEAALKRFPVEMTRIPYQDLIEAFGGKEFVDFNSTPRRYFQLGYKQAEKDLALTWEDISKIDAIITDVNNEFAVDYSKEIDRKKFYEEVLQRFKELIENHNM